MGMSKQEFVSQLYNDLYNIKRKKRNKYNESDYYALKKAVKLTANKKRRSK